MELCAIDGPWMFPAWKKSEKWISLGGILNGYPPGTKARRLGTDLTFVSISFWLKTLYLDFMHFAFDYL